jgi:hypothetical protein
MADLHRMDALWPGKMNYRWHFFVHSIGMVAIVQLTEKVVLSTLENKLATW